MDDHITVYGMGAHGPYAVKFTPDGSEPTTENTNPYVVIFSRKGFSHIVVVVRNGHIVAMMEVSCEIVAEIDYVWLQEVLRAAKGGQT